MTERKLAWTVEEAAERANCSRATMFLEIKAGRLAARKMGRKTLILDADLKAFLQALPMRKVA
jgi:excisionase family DNA binding protein